MSTSVIASRLGLALSSGLGTAFWAYAAFSISDTSVKAIGSRLSPFEIAFFITVVSGAVLPFAKLPGERWRDLFVMRRPVLTLFRSVASTLAGIFSILALTRIPFAEAYALIFIAPIIALFLSILLLAEPVGWRRWSSVAAGIVGVLVVTRPGFRELGLGHVSAFAAAFCVAASIVLLRVLGAVERSSTIYAMLTVVALVILLPLMLIQGYVAPEPAEWGLLLLSGIAAGVGQVGLMAATRLAPANLIAPLQYSQFGWAILYGASFFAEWPDALTVLGLLFIVASGLVLIQRRPRAAVVAPGPL
jgi:drug/metabolite transporter (DMT)-like permease